MKEYETFEDLEFKPREIINWKIAIMYFDNEYGVVVTYRQPNRYDIQVLAQTSPGHYWAMMETERLLTKEEVTKHMIYWQKREVKK